MRLSHTGKPDNYYYFVIEDCRTETGRRTSRTIEKLGCARAIREKYKVDDHSKDQRITAHFLI